jgi:hypothetical protein
MLIGEFRMLGDVSPIVKFSDVELNSEIREDRDKSDMPTYMVRI